MNEREKRAQASDGVKYNISIRGIISGIYNLILNNGEDEAIRRINICEDCEYCSINRDNNSDDNKLLRCTKCGCYILIKAR